MYMQHTSVTHFYNTSKIKWEIHVAYSDVNTVYYLCAIHSWDISGLKSGHISEKSQTWKHDVF